MRAWGIGLLVGLAVGCAQILGFDGEVAPYPGMGGGGAGGSAVNSGTSGTGGAGTGGMAQGGAGTGGSPTTSSGGGGITYTWDAQTETINADGTFTLPPWLIFESETPGRTSQTSGSTLKIGFGVNAPRARNVTGMPADWGLSIESERKNVVWYSDGWNDMWPYVPSPSAMTVVPMQADPAGGTAATLFQSAGNQVSPYFIASGRAVSGWLRGEGNPGDPGMPGGPLSFAHFRHFDSPGAPYEKVDSTTWTRYSFIDMMNVSAAIALETRDRPSGAGSILTPTQILAYGAQIEPDAAYPSSYIPTISSDVTRKAEKLSSPMIDTLMPGGYFRVELRFAPNYASGEQATSHDLLTISGNDNRLYLRHPDNVIVLFIEGQQLESDPLQWSREQQLTVIAVHTATERMLAVTGATSGNGVKMGMGGQAAQLASALYILSDPMGGAQECADLRFISFAQP